MKEILTAILTSYITWIAIEIIAIAILAFFVVRFSRRNRAIKAKKDRETMAYRYKELDGRLANDKRRDKR